MENGIRPQGSMIINAQYIKDLSFENPKAPASFAQDLEFGLGIEVDVNAAQLEENVYEVVLTMQVNASDKSETYFIVDCKYAGIFTLEEENNKEQVLFVQCPTMLFPYMRRIIADVTRDGGYQSLNLAPIDFYGMYLQKVQGQGNNIGKN